MACPLPKQQRSNYIHLDSIEPTTWACIAALFQDIGIGSVSGNLPITAGDTASIDAFARLRVSNPVTLFDSQNHYDDHRIHWQTSIDNNSGNASATHSPNTAEVQLYVEDDDTIIRQTRRYFRYQPGKSQLILVTFVMDSADAECTQRVGYFDAQNGIFFENDGTGYNIVRRSYTTGTAIDTQVAQANWNIDSFDGSGPSGVTLDFSKAQIFLMDMEWLGVGRVRCGFVVDGIPYYAHEFLHANSVTSVYMTTPNLPIRYEISGTVSLATGKTLQAICSSVMSEGGFQIASGLQFSVSNETTLRSVSDSVNLPVLVIRPKLTFGGVVNRGRIIVENISVYAASQPIHYDVYWGGTASGGSWSSANADSITEYNVSASTISGGVKIASGYIPASNQNRGLIEHQNTADYPMFLDIDGNHPSAPYTDQFSVVLKAISTSTNCGASIDVRELR
jgi:hypothetical protein